MARRANSSCVPVTILLWMVFVAHSALSAQRPGQTLATPTIRVSVDSVLVPVVVWDARGRAIGVEREGNILGELAAGTGGTYFHNSNDLQGGLQQLMAGPEYVYVLAFSLDGVKRDDSYHALSVKVNRPGAIVQARSGYFAPTARKKDK